jgi:hypothetical protein
VPYPTIVVNQTKRVLVLIYLKRLTLACCLILSLINLGLFSPKLQAQINIDNKAKLTAAFIYQITKFTLWPDALFVGQNSIFSICMLGEKNKYLNAYLVELENRSTQGHNIEVVQLDNKQQLFSPSGSSCKVLLATDKQWQDLSSEQKQQLAQSTLLIGNSKEFLNNGGMLALLVIDNKMTIFINPQNLEKTPIRLESRLKALAKLY